MLNQDGTPVIDEEGEPVQTYTPIDVQTMLQCSPVGILLTLTLTVLETPTTLLSIHFVPSR
jgi:hypothetical protein